jgi:aminoglycoside phosphotransferase
VTRPTEPVAIPSVVTLDAEVCRLGWAADLAVAACSLRYNYKGDWRREFFNAYGVAPDQDRMDHYLRLWEDGD